MAGEYFYNLMVRKDQELKQQQKEAEQAYQKALATGDQAQIDQAKLGIDNAKKARAEYNEERKKYAINKVIEFSKKFYDDIASRDPGNSATVRRDLVAGALGLPHGNTLDVQAEKAQGISDNAKRETAVHQMEAQQAQGIADRNAYSESEKQAAQQGAAVNRQAQNNESAAAGTGAFMNRTTVAPDVKYQEGRQDTQRARAAEQRQKQLNSQATADMSASDANQFKVASRDYNSSLDESDRLTKGNSYEDEQNSIPTDKPEDKPAKTPTETTPEPQPEPQPETQPPINYESQHVINAILGSSKGQDLREGKGNSDDQKMYNWIISHGIKPLTPKSQNPNLWESEFLTLNGDKGKEVMQMLREGRSPSNAQRNFAPNEQSQMRDKTPFDLSNGTQFNGYAKGTSCAKPGYALVGENGPEIVRMNGGEQVIPNDKAMQVLSDIRCKMVKERFDKFGMGDLTPEEFIFIAKQQGGKFNHNGKDYDFFDEENDWDDEESVLDGYAEYIKNYLYNYKTEAKGIDPSIDPNEDHIGPMAQDIEKVNPACVKETSEGVKTVDTGRLAMMNAGAIGELARQLKELKEVLNGR